MEGPRAEPSPAAPQPPLPSLPTAFPGGREGLHLSPLGRRVSQGTGLRVAPVWAKPGLGPWANSRACWGICAFGVFQHLLGVFPSLPLGASSLLSLQ